MKLLVELDCVDDNWLSSTKILLESLKPAMAEGRIMLVRLGKYGGAENKTIKKLAHIRIKPSKGAAFFAQETLTVWLASDSQSKNAQKMLPFGWAIIEINPQGDNRALKAWCEKNHSSLNRIKQVHQKWEQDRFHEIEQQQAQLKKEQEAEQQRKKEEEDRIAKELAQKQEQQAKRAAMSEGTLCVDNIKLLFENFTYNLRNQSENDAKFSELKEALIVAQQFSLNEKQIVVNELAYKKLAAIAKGLLVGNKEKEIKSLLQQLREA
ncbi:hypothetical protein V757_11515 [Pelistega indica]|uniref:Uncharacterized protein n=1 Tax=Pelistega indica TaxID=1414851 RepID=V8FT36_9BURK|nr:cell envelope integrity protein TolA [Pelistega indica]ETD67320.1 hypothetical protein V757_11515 [Pelistega indica]